MRATWSNLVKSVLLAHIIATATDRPENIIVYDKGYRFDRNGWIYIHIEGEPYERGIQYGYLAALELQEIMKNIRYLTYWDTGKDWQFFVDAGEKLFIPNIDQEYLQEIKG
ncbi:MAG: hypothetical protein ABR985_20630, partial [Methanotrichaceae archaeon]